MIRLVADFIIAAANRKAITHFLAVDQDWELAGSRQFHLNFLAKRNFQLYFDGMQVIAFQLVGNPQVTIA